MGRVIDVGANNPFDMGSAMAPAAAMTLKAHFEDFKTNPSDYDLILTGDLGVVGSDILCDIMNKKSPGGSLRNEERQRETEKGPTL